jgi:hypothetical protein
MLKKLLLTAGAVLAVSPVYASASYQHVLLISIDGMHGIDLQNFVNSNPTSTLASLAAHGVTYTDTLTTAPSDSFPGMIAQVTGATPLTADIFYDDSFDRTAYAAGSNCQGAPGVETNLAEPLDKDQTRLDAGGKLGYPLTQLNRAALPMKISNGHCHPVLPHVFIKANTVFEIAKAAGMRTAWSDKHPAYEILQGPSGQGIDDLFTPEVNSNNILGGSGDNTQSFNAIRAYDQVKVDAIIHEIDGFNSIGTSYVGVPAIFGMNFQSVSVGQKLAVSGPTDPPGLIGGYLDANATPNNAMVLQLAYVDTAIGQMVTELKNQGLSGSTLIIVSAKHGQSPIDLTLRTTRDDSQYFPQAPAYAFEIADDEVLFWMVPSEQTTQRPATWSYLQSVAQPANVQQWYDAETLQGTYKNPLTDPRTPDFIGVAVHGTIYTTGTKLAEHGGFADDDRHVALVVSGTTVPQGDAVNDPILTTQIAPTILRALGLNPHLLDGVRLEKTEALPDLGL